MFNFLRNKNSVLKQEKELDFLKYEEEKSKVVNSIVFVNLAESGAIDDVTATEHTELFSPWASGIQYIVGDLRQYKEELYRCIQAHTSQDDWTPDVSASLWSKVGDPKEEYPQWVLPIGAHDAYSLGDKVTFKDIKYVSVVENNIWQPDVYGWEEE